MRRRLAVAVVAACGLALPAAGAETYPNVDIYRLAPGSSARNLTMSPGLDTAASPSPDGKLIAFVSSRDGRPEIYVMPAAGGGPKRLTTSPFDGETVAWNEAGKTSVAWSPNGRQIAFDVQNASYPPDCVHLCVVWSVYVADADGTGLRAIASPARSPSWSADGALIAYENDISPYGDSDSIAIARPDGSSVRRIVGYNGNPSVPPAWSPRRNELAFQANRAVYTVRADGAGRHRLARGSNLTWAPDGTTIAYVRDGGIYRVTRTGSAIKRLTRSGITAFQPSWSPNGRSIAFLAGSKAGPTQVAVIAASGGATGRLTSLPAGSTFDGSGPVWARRAGAILLSLRPPG